MVVDLKIFIVKFIYKSSQMEILWIYIYNPLKGHNLGVIQISYHVYKSH